MCYGSVCGVYGLISLSYGFYYGFDGFNLWCVPNDIMRVLWLFLIFSIAFSCYNPRTNPVLRSLSTLVEYICDAH